MTNGRGIRQFVTLRLVCFATGVAVGCADPLPRGVSQLHTCIMTVAMSAKAERGGISADCEIPPGWSLVGIPSGQIQASELVGSGVDREIAEMLVAGDKRNARWCVARGVPRDPSKDRQTTAQSSCIDSDLPINVPLHSAATKVRLVVASQANGSLAFRDLQP
jgi:hypothetical protein